MIARAEIPADIDVELLDDALGELIYWRAIVTGRRMDASYLDRLASSIVAMARGGAPAP